MGCLDLLSTPGKLDFHYPKAWFPLVLCIPAMGHFSPWEQRTDAPSPSTQVCSNTADPSAYYLNLKRSFWHSPPGCNVRKIPAPFKNSLVLSWCAVLWSGDRWSPLDCVLWENRTREPYLYIILGLVYLVWFCCFVFCFILLGPWAIHKINDARISGK